MVRVRCSLLLLVAASWPSLTHAFVDTPSITPPRPSSSTPITVHVRAGDCHVFLDDVNEAELVNAGNGQLRLVVDGVASLEPGNPFCIYPVFTYRFVIGTLPAGGYTLQIFIRDTNFPATPVAFGTVSFSVSATPSVVPALSNEVVALTMVLMLCAGLLARSRRDSVLAVGVAGVLAAMTPVSTQDFAHSNRLT